jgi:two-component system response regulator AtoC
MLNERFPAWLESVGASVALDALMAAFGQAAVFAVDADQTIVLWSDSAERLLGFSASEVLGEHCLKANRCPACIEDCGIKRHTRIQGAPITLFGKTGEPVQVLKYAQAFRDDAGRFLGAIEVLVPRVKTTAAVSSTPRPAQVVVRGETFQGMTSIAPAMHRIFQVCRNVAETNANALIRGESGTGKELVARALHAESARAGGPFVPVNCAALTPTLAESELFGHVKGAFTGAISDRAGIFEQAAGGTLFLDEVAELPPALQAKLLRVLEARTVTRVGDVRERPIDVRVVAATHRSLRAMVAGGYFRADLI